MCKSDIVENKGGKGVSSWLQNECVSCGFEGEKYHASNDYQLSDLRNDRAIHEKACLGKLEIIDVDAELLACS